MMSALKLLEHATTIAPIALSLLFLATVSSVIYDERMQVGAFVFLLSFLLATDTFPAPVTALFPLLLLPAQGLASAQHVSSLYMRDDQVVFLTMMFTLVTLAECGVYNRCAIYALKSVRGSIPALMAIVMGVAVAMALVSGDVDSSLVLLPMAGVLADEVYLDYIESEPMQSRNLDSGVITPVPAPQQLQGGGAEPDQGASGGGAIASSSVPEPGENIAPLPEGAQTQQRPSNCAHATFASVLGKPRRSVSFKKRVLMHKDHRDRALFLEEKNVFQQSMAMAIVCGATLGVSASIVGPSPSKKLNLYLERKYGADSTVGLLNWIFYSVPSTAVSCVIGWWYLSYNKIPARIMDPETKLASCIFERRWALLGPAGFAECAAVAILISLMFAGYLFRYGVLGLHKNSRVNQVVVSLALAALLFLVPAEPTLTDKSPPLVSWTTLCRKTPWACLFLLGCANVVIQQIQNTRIDSFVVALLGGGLRSAAPTSVLLLSIVASLQAELTPYGRDYDTLFEAVDQEAMLSKQNPLLFLVPVVKALSFVGILPLAHYPCALLYENFGISVPGMMKTGVPFKCTLLLLELLTLSTLGLPFFGLDKMPAWARAAAANLSAHDETKRS